MKKVKVVQEGIVIRSGSVYQHDLHRDHYTEYRDWDRTGMQSQETLFEKIWGFDYVSDTG